MERRLIFLVVVLLAFFSLVLVFVNDYRLIGFAIRNEACASAHDEFLDLSRSYDCTDKGDIVICQKGGNVISYERTDSFEKWVLNDKTSVHYFDKGTCEVV